MASAYDKGFEARMCDQQIHENPYSRFSTDHANWNVGWRDQDRHLNSREDALEAIGWFGPDGART